MTPPSDREKELERFVAGTVRALPPRRAPRTLEFRVLAEIERRAALPWWRKSFGHWPAPARAGFLVVSTALAAVIVLVGLRLTTGVDQSIFGTLLAQPLAWLESGKTVANAIGGFGDIVLRNIPPLWLYGSLAVIATLYLMLFGLGAAAYKALFVHR